MAQAGMGITPHHNFMQKNTGRLAYTKPDVDKTESYVFFFFFVIYYHFLLLVSFDCYEVLFILYFIIRPFLISNTPYVDPYLHESIRVIDKSKWLASSDFSSTLPKKVHLFLSPSLSPSLPFSPSLLLSPLFFLNNTQPPSSPSPTRMSALNI